MLTLLLALSAASDPGVPVDDAVAARLSARHLDDPCAAVAPLGEAPVVLDALVRVADEVSMPPWVAPRAAACVGRRLDEPLAREAAARWIGDPDRAGLALVVLDQLDVAPADTAVSLARLAHARREDARFWGYAAPRLRRSPHAEVARLAQDPLQ